MRFVAPELEIPVRAIAEEQEQYQTVYAGLVNFPGAGPAHLLCIRFDELELERIMNGEDLYISLLTFGGPMTPVWVNVGKESTALALGVEVLKR